MILYIVTFAAHQKFAFYTAVQGESVNVFVTSSLMVLSLVLYLSEVPNMKCSQ